MPENRDYYQILNVSENATQEEIKKSFRRLARDCHPDLHPNDARAAERFRILREAYEVLSNTDRRKKYDRRRQKQAGKHQEKRTPQVYYVRGAEKLLVKDYRGAINALTEAVRLNPRFIEAYLKRCEAYLAIGNERAVLEDCQTILRYQPDSAIAYYYRGRARQRLGYADSAVKAYSKAIRLQKNFAAPYYYRGIVYYELRYRNQAICDWREYAEISREQGDLRGYRLGMDIISRCSWLQIKPGNRTLSQWWRWGKERMGMHVQTTSKFGFQGLATLKNGISRAAAAVGLLIATESATLLQVMKNPVGGILPAYGKLDAKMTGIVSVGFIAIANTCFLLGLIFRGMNWEAAWRLLAVGTIPIFSLFLVSLITRSLLQHHRHWTGDLFFASSALLPLAFLILLTAFIGELPNVVFLIGGMFALSHTILLLYGGCTQLLNVSESQAALLVPIMILIATLLTWIVASQLFLPLLF